MSYADLKGEHGELWTSRVDMGEVHVYKDLTVEGEIICDKFNVPVAGVVDFDVGNVLTVSGSNLADPTKDAALFVTRGLASLSRAYIDNELIVHGNTFINEDLNVDGNTELGGSLKVGGGCRLNAVTIDNDLTVNGTIHWTNLDPPIHGGGGGTYPTDAVFDTIRINNSKGVANPLTVIGGVTIQGTVMVPDIYLVNYSNTPLSDVLKTMNNSITIVERSIETLQTKVDGYDQQIQDNTIKVRALESEYNTIKSTLDSHSTSLDNVIYKSSANPQTIQTTLVVNRNTYVGQINDNNRVVTKGELPQGTIDTKNFVRTDISGNQQLSGNLVAPDFYYINNKKQISLKTALSTLNTGIKTNETNISTVNGLATNNQERIQSLENTISQYKTSYTTLQGDVSALGRRVETCETNIQANTQKVGELEQKVQNNTDKVDTLENTVRGYNDRIDTCETNIRNNTSRLESEERNVSEMNRVLEHQVVYLNRVQPQTITSTLILAKDTYIDNNDDTKNRVATLKDVQAGGQFEPTDYVQTKNTGTQRIGGTLEGVDFKYKEGTNYVSTKEAIINNAQRIGGLQEEIEKHAKRIDDVETKQVTIDTNITNLSSTVEQNVRAINAHTELINGHARQIEDNAKKIGENAKAIETNADNIKKAQQTADDNTKKLEGVVYKDANVTQTINGQIVFSQNAYIGSINDDNRVIKRSDLPKGTIVPSDFVRTTITSKQTMKGTLEAPDLNFQQGSTSVSVKSVINNHADRIATNEKNLKQIQESIDSINDATKNNTESIKSINESIEGVNKTIEDHADKIKANAGAIETNKEAIEKNTKLSGENKTAITGINTTIETINNDMTAIKKDIKTNKEAITTNTEDIEKNAKLAGENKTAITGINTTIETINNDMTTIKKDIKTNKETITTNKEAIEKNAKLGDENKKAITGINTTIETINNDMTTIKKDIKTNKEAITTNTEAIEKNAKLADENKNAINDLKGTLEKLQGTDLDSIKKDIKTNASAIEDTKTEAENAKTTAEKAKATADEAKTAAEDTKTTAESAKSTAEKAKTTADEAKTAAEDTKTTAVNAKTTADEAKTTADGNKTALEANTKRLNEAIESIDDNSKSITAHQETIVSQQKKIAAIDEEVTSTKQDFADLDKIAVKQYEGHVRRAIDFDELINQKKGGFATEFVTPSLKVAMRAAVDQMAEDKTFDLPTNESTITITSDCISGINATVDAAILSARDKLTAGKSSNTQNSINKISGETDFPKYLNQDQSKNNTIVSNGNTILNRLFVGANCETGDAFNLTPYQTVFNAQYGHIGMAAAYPTLYVPNLTILDRVTANHIALSQDPSIDLNFLHYKKGLVIRPCDDPVDGNQLSFMAYHIVGEAPKTTFMSDTITLMPTKNAFASLDILKQTQILLSSYNTRIGIDYAETYTIDYPNASGVYEEKKVQMHNTFGDATVYGGLDITPSYLYRVVTDQAGHRTLQLYTDCEQALRIDMHRFPGKTALYTEGVVKVNNNMYAKGFLQYSDENSVKVDIDRTYKETFDQVTTNKLNENDEEVETVEYVRTTPEDSCASLSIVGSAYIGKSIVSNGSRIAIVNPDDTTKYTELTPNGMDTNCISIHAPEDPANFTFIGPMIMTAHQIDSDAKITADELDAVTLKITGDAGVNGTLVAARLRATENLAVTNADASHASVIKPTVIETDAIQITNNGTITTYNASVDNELKAVGLTSQFIMVSNDSVQTTSAITPSYVTTTELRGVKLNITGDATVNGNAAIDGTVIAANIRATQNLAVVSADNTYATVITPQKIETDALATKDVTLSSGENTTQITPTLIGTTGNITANGTLTAGTTTINGSANVNGGILTQQVAVVSADNTYATNITPQELTLTDNGNTTRITSSIIGTTGDITANGTITTKTLMTGGDACVYGTLRVKNVELLPAVANASNISLMPDTKSTSSDTVQFTIDRDRYVTVFCSGKTDCITTVNINGITVNAIRLSNTIDSANPKTMEYVSFATTIVCELNSSDSTTVQVMVSCPIVYYYGALFCLLNGTPKDTTANFKVMPFNGMYDKTF